MAKNSKKSKQEVAPAIDPAASTVEAQNGVSPAVSREGGAAKGAAAKTAKSGANAKPKTRRSSSPALKGATGSRPRKEDSRKVPRPSEAISDDKIRLRAYFISEWRMQNGIAGGSADDWLEARRQLQEEANQRA
jgi:hypothetical protein